MVHFVAKDFLATVSFQALLVQLLVVIIYTTLFDIFFFILWRLEMVYLPITHIQSLIHVLIMPIVE